MESFISLKESIKIKSLFFKKESIMITLTFLFL